MNDGITWDHVSPLFLSLPSAYIQKRPRRAETALSESKVPAVPVISCAVCPLASTTTTSLNAAEQNADRARAAGQAAALGRSSRMAMIALPPAQPLVSSVTVRESHRAMHCLDRAGHSMETGVRAFERAVHLRI